MEKKELEALLKTCAEEPIHKLGAIQDFACLFAIDLEDLKIKVVSENFDLFGVEPEKCIGAKVTDFVFEESIQKIIQSEELKSFKKEYLVELFSKNLEAKWKFYTYRTNQLLVFEHEFQKSRTQNFVQENAVNTLAGLSIHAENESGIKGLAKNLAKSLHSLIRFDRVMIYKFHSDRHGEVIAEAKKEKLASFLGLHYPESDIPKQARILYTKNLLRIIPNVNSKKVSLISKDIDIEEFNLSDSISRYVSIMHIEYLKNMGVEASLSISIVVDGQLWGLIACHHYSPKFMSFPDRSFLKLISQSFAAEIARIKSGNLNLRVRRVNLLIQSMIEAIKLKSKDRKEGFLQEIINKNRDEILSHQAASGFFLKVGDHEAQIGNVPDQKLIDYVHSELNGLESESKVFSNRNISEKKEEFKYQSKIAAGAIGVGAGDINEKCFAIWFRPEFIEEVRWGGKNEEKVKVVNGVHRLSPRGSFDEIAQIEKFRSIPFSEEDKAVASEFFWFLSKVAVELLEESEKAVTDLEQNAQEKDLFISTLSHELRTPLNNILGWLELYRHRLEEDEELGEMARVIYNSSKQQLALVNDLLDISKLAKGKINLKKKIELLSGIVEEIGINFKPDFKEKNIQHKINVEENIVARVDKLRVEQVLRNIIENAIKFTPKNGKITIELAKKSETAVIKVVDTGAGIEPSHLNSVFDQFFQVKNKKSKVNKGLGLGLALSKQLVDMHGGSISMDSEGVGKGTTVTVRLPILKNEPGEAKEEKIEKKKENYAPLKGLKVLLIEDSPESARFVELFLAELGASITWVDEGGEGLNYLRKETFDIVLADIGLPDMSGFAFLKKAKELEKAKDIPFLAFSAYGEESEIQKSIDLGFDDHIVKPVSFNKLLKTVLRYASKNERNS